MTVPPAHRLCCYCGSSTGHNPLYAEAARGLGDAMAAAGMGLVYGGGGVGLMGTIARAVLAAGGHVTGIIPDFLVSKERMLDGVSELMVTTNMHERKMAMFERATGFVALPGGIGTLEELTEILTWAQLQQHARPVIILNTDGYWSPLIKLFEQMKGEGFIRPGLDITYDVVSTPGDVIKAYHRRLAAQKDKPPVALLKDKL
ncbi:MAG: TIGR00730 family Rossman fold protein [Hyphomicrobiales bacterium]